MAKNCNPIVISNCPPTGECDTCKEIISSACVKYSGDDLECIEVTSGDKLDEILLKIDSKVCNIGEGSESNVPSDEVVSVSIKIITGEDFTDVGGGVYEYVLDATQDAGKTLVVNVDADVYSGDYRITVPNDLCVGIEPFPAIKVGYYFLDLGRFQLDSDVQSFVKPLSANEGNKIEGSGRAGEPIIVVYADLGGSTLALPKCSIINRGNGEYYTPDYWHFRNDVNLMPIVEDGSYHLKEGVNIIYADSDIDGITIYVDAGINFKYEDIQLYVAGYKVTNVVWRDNDDFNNDITASRNLPSTLQAGDFVKIKNMEDNDFIVLENYKKPAYYNYTALLTQEDTSDPVAVVLENNLRFNITWQRTNTGVYVATPSIVAAFPANKTAVMVGKGSWGITNANVMVDNENNASNTLLFNTFSSDGVISDYVLKDCLVEIRIYK